MNNPAPKLLIIERAVVPPSAGNYSRFRKKLTGNGKQEVKKTTVENEKQEFGQEKEKPNWRR